MIITSKFIAEKLFELHQAPLATLYPLQTITVSDREIRHFYVALLVAAITCC